MIIFLIYSLTLFFVLSSFHVVASIDDRNGNTGAAATIRTIPIVFVYILPERSCTDLHLPKFLISSMEQILSTQIGYDVYFITNAVKCESTIQDYSTSTFQQHFYLIDSDEIMSPRSMVFKNNTLLGTAEYGLYTTSALRFFLLLDFMKTYKHSSILHVEGDNLLYAPMQIIKEILETSYPVLTVEALTIRGKWGISSIAWVPTIDTLHEFTEFLLELVIPENELFIHYRTTFNKGDCRADHDRCVFKINGVGIKLYSMNEMSFLGYYKHMRNNSMTYFPALPFELQQSTIDDLGSYAINGSEVGPDILGGVWDPGSWGQYIDGKSGSRHSVVSNHYPTGKVHFIDNSHIVGAAIVRHACNVTMECSSVFRRDDVCLTAPFVYCNANPVHTPLWNLHLHSKRTFNYKSVPCECPQAL